MNLLLADMEGTLTTGSSWRAFGRYVMAHGDPWQYRMFILRWLPRYLLVELGLYDKQRAMEQWMAQEIALIRGWPRSQVNELATWISEHEMWPKRRKNVLQDVKSRQSDDTKMVFVSSAYQPIVDAFAQHLDAEAIGTPLNFEGGRVKGLQFPVNAYQQKAANIQDQFPGGDILAAYGDTASDIPMMEISQNPIAVYPDRDLRQVAEARGWRILDS